MSLDVYLETGEVTTTDRKIMVRENGRMKEITREEWERLYPGREPVAVLPHETTEVFTANITHNLAAMAAQAGIYKLLWRPDENGISLARQLIEPLETGLHELCSNPEKYRQYNPENGWGHYEGLCDFVRDYLAACRKWPEAVVTVSR
jgi:hypothetical protein